MAGVFRRRDSTATAPGEGATGSGGPTTKEPPKGAKTEGKGRPTPKRKDAEGRRQPLRAPADRKDAYKQVKNRQKDERRRAKEGLSRGDERYLPARDKGPVRKLARDYVDSRRSVGEFFLFIALLVIVLTAVPLLSVQRVAYNVIFPLLLVAIVVESYLVQRRVKRLAAQRHPDESTRGLALYSITRNMQFRRLRLPPPKVKPGQEV